MQQPKNILYKNYELCPYFKYTFVYLDEMSGTQILQGNTLFP